MGLRSIRRKVYKCLGIKIKYPEIVINHPDQAGRRRLCYGPLLPVRQWHNLSAEQQEQLLVVHDRDLETIVENFRQRVVNLRDVAQRDNNWIRPAVEAFVSSDEEEPQPSTSREPLGPVDKSPTKEEKHFENKKKEET